MDLGDVARNARPHLDAGDRLEPARTIHPFGDPLRDGGCSRDGSEVAAPLALPAGKRARSARRRSAGRVHACRKASARRSAPSSVMHVRSPCLSGLGLSAAGIGKPTRETVAEKGMAGTMLMTGARFGVAGGSRRLKMDPLSKEKERLIEEGGPASVPAMSSREWAMLLALSRWEARSSSWAWPWMSFRLWTLVFLRVAIAAPVLILVARFTGQRVPRDARAHSLFAAMGLCNSWSSPSCFSPGRRITSRAACLDSMRRRRCSLFCSPSGHARRAPDIGACGGRAGLRRSRGHDRPGGVSRRGGFRAGTARLPRRRRSCIQSRPFSAAAFAPWASRPRSRRPVKSALQPSILLPAALLVDRIWTLPIPGWPAAGAVLGSGLLSTAIAYLLYFRILATAGAPMWCWSRSLCPRKRRFARNPR